MTAASNEEEEWQRTMDTLSSLISSKRRGDGHQWQSAFEMMASYLQRLSLERELPRLSVIHVAGTKGKGSTCAMVESMLRACGYHTGLYTSPHLVDVRERIRIDGELVDRPTFLRNLWWCYDTLRGGSAPEGASMAAYFRFLTLLGFRIFLEQQASGSVDVAVLEVGIGGRLDATNCVPRPVACGVAPLGYDHMELLGDTLPQVGARLASLCPLRSNMQQIATEKAGIFKPDCPAFTVPQPEDALAALRAKAEQVGAPLAVVRPWESYANASSLRLGLAGEHQKVNAALALALVAAWEASTPEAAARNGGAAARRAAQLAAGVIPAEYAAGLERVHWPGRSHIVHDYAAADGDSAAGEAAAGTAAAGAAATEAGKKGRKKGGSLFEGCAPAPRSAWAVASSSAASSLAHPMALTHASAQEREPQKLLAPLAATLAERRVPVHYALFVPPDSQYFKVGASGEPADLTWQHSLRAVWENLCKQGRTPVARAAGGAAPAAAPQLPQLPAVPSLLPPCEAGQGAVLPNLRVTLDWLRRCVREAPTLRMRVLVTGSLYVVGDMLKLLGGPGGDAASPNR
eukprot:scaffold2.g7527.t1